MGIVGLRFRSELACQLPLLLAAEPLDRGLPSSERTPPVGALPPHPSCCKLAHHSCRGTSSSAPDSLAAPVTPGTTHSASLTGGSAPSLNGALPLPATHTPRRLAPASNTFNGALPQPAEHSTAPRHNQQRQPPPAAPATSGSTHHLRQRPLPPAALFTFFSTHLSRSTFHVRQLHIPLLTAPWS